MFDCYPASGIVLSKVDTKSFLKSHPRCLHWLNTINRGRGLQHHEITNTVYRMLKNKLIISISLIAILCLIQYYFFSPSLPHKPNIVLIVGDAVRPDFLSIYGGEADTPNLDWLAGQGIVFENAFCNSPWTAPSSVSIFTGNYATTYNTTIYSRSTTDQNKKSVKTENSVQVIVPQESFLFPEYLEQQGYSLKKNIENWNADIHNALQGFTPFPLEKENNQAPAALLNIKQITGWYDTGSGKQQKLIPVLDYLIDKNTSGPFFLVQWFLDPHAPYHPSKKFRDKILIEGKRLDDSTTYFAAPRETGATQYSDFENTVNKSLYIAAIESVDERIGFIINALKHRNLLQQTIFIFTSDHAEEFGEHGQWGHGSFGKECKFNQTLMKIPLVIAGPKIPRGKRIKQHVAHIDLMPTLNELLGGNYAGDMQGESLLPVMHGKLNRNREIYFNNIVQNQQVDALLIDKIKIVSMQDGTFKLYDIEGDPNETKDLSSAMSSIMGTMQLRLLAIRSENKDKRLHRKKSSGFTPKSKEEEHEIFNQLKSLGYTK